MEQNGFEWLTEEICREYLERAKELPEDDGTDTGRWRALRMELQKRCNITEIQAFNILRGQYIDEYVQIYGLKSGRISLPPEIQARLEKKKKKGAVEEKLREAEERIEELESLKNVYYSSYNFEEKD
jgi:hypothetical protein